MNKINFQNLPSTATPLNATNLNQLQTNVENEFTNVEADYKGTVLFDNPSGVNDNIVLSENASNYTRIVIYYGTSIGNYYIRGSEDIIVTDGCDFAIDVASANSATLQLHDVGRWHISGNTITKVFETGVRFGDGNSIYWEGATTRTLISKIVGFNY